MSLKTPPRSFTSARSGERAPSLTIGDSAPRVAAPPPALGLVGARRVPRRLDALEQLVQHVDVVAEDDGSLHVVAASGLDEGPKIADYDAVSLFPSAMGELDEGKKKAMKLMLASGYGKPWGNQ